MKVVTIVGARPQFVKAATISRILAGLADVDEIMVHTGQHYDENMSEIFFEEMDIPRPAYRLEAGGGSHGEMTGRMLGRIEEVLVAERPDRVLVYGDTNSTLAGALAAAKLHIPVVHIEAGLRSFNRRMPEEVNRVLVDHLAELLFCPTRLSVANLAQEGITSGVHHVGDVMFDASLIFGAIAEQRSIILQVLGVEPKRFSLATVHRAENTDDPARLGNLLEAFVELAASDHQLILPLHPRTRGCVERLGLGAKLASNPYVRVIEPVSFLDMVLLEKSARMILTDSGGVQKEAYFHGVPCITLRDETEWVETVEAGWNTLVAADKNRIIAAAEAAATKAAKGGGITDYGRGDAADRIVGLLKDQTPHV